MPGQAGRRGEGGGKHVSLCCWGRGRALSHPVALPGFPRRSQLLSWRERPGAPWQCPQHPQNPHTCHSSDPSLSRRKPSSFLVLNQFGDRAPGDLVQMQSSSLLWGGAGVCVGMSFCILANAQGMPWISIQGNGGGGRRCMGAGCRAGLSGRALRAPGHSSLDP